MNGDMGKSNNNNGFFISTTLDGNSSQHLASFHILINLHKNEIHLLSFFWENFILLRSCFCRESTVSSAYEIPL